MDLFRKCMEPVEKCLRDAKMDKSSVGCCMHPFALHKTARNVGRCSYMFLAAWQGIPCFELDMRTSDIVLCLCICASG